MSSKRSIVVDGNEAVASVAYRLNEVIAIYPITPATPMGEWADQWAAERRPNLWGAVPLVVEMQSEGGAAGAVHGALQTGSLTTTFTASQGLLLMIPNMYKIAGELTATVFHVAARTVATHALSIFGDHSDVMAARATGFALLASNTVQEAMDLAAIAQAATLEARVPFVHFFDGFRTSHELMKVEPLPDRVLRALVPDELVHAHRARGLTPERPVLRGSAQNPDVFFQAREAANPYYLATPAIVQRTMDRFAQLTGRQYHLFDYVGAPDAERVVVLMGSGADTAEATVQHLAERGERVGVLKVRLYRPFDAARLVAALPPTVKALAVLDRTKEPGSAGEPLYQDVVTALSEALASGSAPFADFPRVIGGRYGLSSKEFTPAMVKAVLDELRRERPKNHFTVGIVDDVTHTSLEVDPSFSIERPETVRALFYGLGSDGTVSANKNSITIIGEGTELYAQGYFVYDSKKSGSMTVSHLRFGPEPIHAPYLIDQATFVACHQFQFLERVEVLRHAAPGATFLLNSPYGPAEVWDHLPEPVQATIVRKNLRFFIIDAYRLAREVGLGVRINTIMQTCFFALSGVLPREQAIEKIKQAIRKSYAKAGETVLEQNVQAVDQALAHLHEVAISPEVTSFIRLRAHAPAPEEQLHVAVDRTLAQLYEVDPPGTITNGIPMRPPVPPEAPEFVQRVTAAMIAGRGDELPVSALPPDGTFPTGTARWEKRNLAQEIPVWDQELCIQCGKCVLVCPHAVIRAKVVEPAALAGAPPTFKTAAFRGREFPGARYALQVSPEDCTSCGLCVEACPVRDKRDPTRKALNMAPQAPLREPESRNWEFFLGLPEADRRRLNPLLVKDSQFLQPLFEFSGACAGCGETPYLKLLSQLFGDRALVANATGCSSIYGGNLPTTPWAQDRQGRGPAWANSLFEDNAEFGLGFRLTLDHQTHYAHLLVRRLAETIGPELARELLHADQSTEASIAEQRARVARLKEVLAGHQDSLDARDLLSLADTLVRRSVWIVGGDGWAYDIGFGGLDHVLAQGRDVNALVLDTEVYSNTGGQQSKATPRAAVAKFAAGGKDGPKKDLGLLMMSYESVYVAQVALGANDGQAIRAFVEAESYPGPSLIIAYSPCIAHGYDLRHSLDQSRRAVQSGYWPLYRYDPRRLQQGLPPLVLDSKPPSLPLEDYLYQEGRYRILARAHPEAARRLLQKAKQDVAARWRRYRELASHYPEPAANGQATAAAAPAGRGAS